MQDLKEYHRPATPEEAVELKRHYGKSAVYLGGSSDLLVHRPRGIVAAIDIRHAGMSAVESAGDGVVIGGGALLREVEAKAGWVAGGMLELAVRETAPWLIRNAATLAGNIANASPAADSVPALLALDAELTLLDESEERVAVAEVLLGPHRTSLGNRLIRAIHIGADCARRQAAFVKLARSKSDIALVNLAIALRLENGTAYDVRIALGAVAPTVVRARSAEKLLEGQPLSSQLLDQAAEAVRGDISPISDWRASAEYRTRMARVLVRRALGSMIPAEGKGDPR